MRLRREVKVLKSKAIASLRSSVAAFNDPDDDGRHTRVLLSLQHAFEMLLKAALVHTQHRGESVSDNKTGRSIGFEKCVALATERETIKLTDSETGVLRAIDAMRDDEQHWFNQVSEQILYLQARLAITAFDDILRRVFGEYLPRLRVQGDRRPAAAGEAYDSRGSGADPHTDRARVVCGRGIQGVTKDVDRVQTGIRAKQPIAEVFPKLVMLQTEAGGVGTELVVRMSKKEGAPVRYVSDEAVPAAAIREGDLQKKFHNSAAYLAKKLDLTPPRCVALRRHTGIDADGKVAYTFKFASQSHLRFSDHAVTILKACFRNRGHGCGLGDPRPGCETPACLWSTGLRCREPARSRLTSPIRVVHRQRGHPVSARPNEL